MSLENKLFKAKQSNNSFKIEKVFEEIYYEYGKLVGFVISKYISNKQDIEELIDDVFVSFSKIIMKNDITNIKYYLIVQAKNASINFLKSKNNKLQIEYNEEYIDNISLDNSKYYDLINEMKLKLSAEEINIILLHTIYNYSFSEISSKYNKPLPTIASIYKRAIKKFNERTK